jgi:DNA-directed RNA polymerase subunit RPC12/RpoP
MICSDAKCGKKFSAPLELFNGRLTCPYCKNEILVINKFSLTKDSEELYNLSELYFMRYLSPQSCEKKIHIFKQNELLEYAIKNCAEAAKQGNPKAVFRMGFYNEHYLETLRSESDRIRMAFNYYAAICYYEGNNITAEKGVKAFTDEEFKSFKINAALRLLKLASKYPQALKDLKKYDYETNKQRIISLYGNLNFDEKTEKTSKVGKVKYIYQILTSCFNKDRAPLFGTFFLNGNELKNLFAIKKDKTEKKFDFVKLISKGLEIRYLPCSKDGNISQEDKYFIRFSNEEKAKEILSAIRDEEYFILYFFNTHGRHQYLSAKEMERVKKEIADSNYDLLCNLINNAMQEYMFFDDDIIEFKKGNNVKGSAKRLIEYVCGEN